jgi:hypothetical protein
MTVSFIEACFLCQEYSMGLKLATCDPAILRILVLLPVTLKVQVADGTAGSLLAFGRPPAYGFFSP